MKVDFLQTKNDNKKLVKTFTKITSANCELKESSSIIEPVLFVHSNIVKANYMYIPSLDRYYFITDIELQPDGDYIVKTHVDVLMSNSNAILKLNALILRNEFLYNDYIPDDKLLPRCERTHYVRNVGNFGEDYRYYLTTVNGVANT